jgi:hypothetical protein
VITRVPSRTCSGALKKSGGVESACAQRFARMEHAALHGLNPLHQLTVLLSPASCRRHDCKHTAACDLLRAPQVPSAIIADASVFNLVHDALEFSEGARESIRGLELEMCTP